MPPKKPLLIGIYASILKSKVRGRLTNLDLADRVEP